MRKETKGGKEQPTLPPPKTIAEALGQAGMRPIGETLDQRARKQQRATNLSNALAMVFAHALRDRGLAGTLPDTEGKRLESPALTVRGAKRLDVNFSTPQLGLGLGVSIKTMMSWDINQHSYVHNLKRNDEELLVEALSYHKRQPFAVMVAVVFFPIDGAFDTGMKGGGLSSLAKAVKHFRFMASRPTPRDDPEYFEKFFVGLLGVDGGAESIVPQHEQLAAMRGQSAIFVDVMDPPTKSGIPPTWMTFDNMIAEFVRCFERRNSPEFHWAGGASDQEPETGTEEDADEE